MLKTAASYIELRQSIHCRDTVFNKTGVGFRVDTQRSQTGNHLRQRFTGSTFHTGKGAILVLNTTEPGKCLVHCFLNITIGVVVGSQRLQCHAGHIRITNCASQCPTAAKKLCIQNFRNKFFTSHITGRDLIVMGIKCDQRPNGTVDTLVADIVHIIQSSEQVISSHIGYILANCGERNNQAGIIRRLGCMQSSILINVFLHIGSNRMIVAVCYCFACTA